jgi:hypothetical protein
MGQAIAIDERRVLAGCSNMIELPTSSLRLSLALMRRKNPL